MAICQDQDPVYMSFLERLLSRNKSNIVEYKPDRVSSPTYVTNGEVNPNCEKKPKRKRMGQEGGMKAVVIKESGGEKLRVEQGSVQLKKRRKENEKGFKGNELVLRSSSIATYDSDYFNFLSHLKALKTGVVALEVGGEVIVRYEHEVETVEELERQNNRFEEEERNVRKDVLVLKSRKRDRLLETEARAKTVNAVAELEGDEKYGDIGRIRVDSSSFEKSAVGSENDSVIAQVAGFASTKADNRGEIKKHKGGGKECVFQGSDSGYDSDYFNYVSHLKVLDNDYALELNGEVIVQYEQETETIYEFERNTSIDGESGNQVEKDVVLQERMKKYRLSEEEGREKIVKEDAVLEEEEDDRDIDQLALNGLAKVSMRTDDRNGIKRQKVGKSAILKVNELEEKEVKSRQASQGLEKKPTGEQNVCGNLEKRSIEDKKKDASSSSRRGIFDFDWIEEKREEEVLPKEKLKLRCKGNRRGHREMEGFAAFPDLSDSDEPQVDEVPAQILCRPPSDYKDRLIEVLRMPYDKSEYRELMYKASFRARKIIHKELRSGRRALETNQESKSFFDWYPEVKSEVERARHGRRLILLRGLFFWVKNCCCKGSFKPWEKGYNKTSKVYHSISDIKDQH